MAPCGVVLQGGCSHDAVEPSPAHFAEKSPASPCGHFAGGQLATANVETMNVNRSSCWRNMSAVGVAKVLLYGCIGLSLDDGLVDSGFYLP